MVSIIIPVYNCLEYTKQCIKSIRKNTENYEIIIVNNNSSDGTKEYFESERTSESVFRNDEELWYFEDGIFINLKENVGFGKGNNIGYEYASGDYICYLNNDTIVTPYWVERLKTHIYNGADLIGPCTNFVSGKQCKQLNEYSTIETLNCYSDLFYKENKNRYTDVNWIIGYCILMKKGIRDLLGGFDEQFGLGNSEDIDLCIRAKKENLNIRIAEDVYIHHYGHATFKNMSNGTIELCAGLCKSNREKLYKKWGKINYSQ